MSCTFHTNRLAMTLIKR